MQHLQTRGCLLLARPDFSLFKNNFFTAREGSTPTSRDLFKAVLIKVETGRGGDRKGK
jgi:hypothetical protein